MRVLCRNDDGDQQQQQEEKEQLQQQEQKVRPVLLVEAQALTKTTCIPHEMEPTLHSLS